MVNYRKLLMSILSLSAFMYVLNKKNKRSFEMNETKNYHQSERNQYGKNSKGIYYASGNYEAFAKTKKPDSLEVALQV